MKPIDKTHPSLCPIQFLPGLVFSRDKNGFIEMNFGAGNIFDQQSIQKHTIDKAVLKDKLNNFFNKLMTIRGKQSPDYSWEPIEDELFKELELEEK